jgi:hypothetical protein
MEAKARYTDTGSPESRMRAAAVLGRQPGRTPAEQQAAFDGSGQ